MGLELIGLMLLVGAALGDEAEVPNPPTNVHLECTNQTATVTFSYKLPIADHILLPHEFRIQYNDDPDEPSTWHDSARTVKVLNNSEASHTVDLYPGGKFRFRVVARNQYGDSTPAYSEDPSCETPSARPNINPVGVYVKSENIPPNTLMVCWKPLAHQSHNGPDFHYILEYTPADTSNDPPRAIRVDPDRSCLTVTDQHEYKLYRIRVWAANTFGRSSVEPEWIEGYSSEGTPLEGPTDFAWNGGKEFGWRPPAEETIRGRLRRYKIKYWTDDDPTEREFEFPARSTVGFIDRLIPNRTNHATILLENMSGRQSPRSRVISFFVPNGVPSKIDCLRATAHPGGLMRVVWSAPYDFNDHPIGYRLEWCKCTGDKEATAEPEKKARASPFDCHQSPILEPNQTDYWILDLISDQDYWIRVAAISSSGQGRWTRVKARVDLAAIPNDQNPTDWIKAEFKGVFARKYEANLTWTGGKMEEAKESTDHTIAKLAFVTYRKRGTDLWRTIPLSTHDQRWTTIDGLCPATVYDVRVVHSVEIDRDRWIKSEFGASFGTAEPGEKTCVERDLQP